MVPLKKYKLKLNSSEKLEVLLQELYDEACKNIEQIQTEMNKLPVCRFPDRSPRLC